MTTYSLAPLCAWAFNLNIPFFKGILTMCLVHLIIFMTPTPAGSGGAEALFVVAFQPFIRCSGFSVVALWRFLSEYAKVIAGGLFTFLEMRKAGLKIEKED